MLPKITLLALLLLPLSGQAVEYQCKVEKKFDSVREYTSEQIVREQYSVQIKEENGETLVSRCSFVESAQKVTCDEYQIDKVVQDPNVKIKKYYLFKSQFDVQLFPSMFFVENNGRGGIAYGKCKIVAP
jgi:hypothetical protein